MSASLDDELQPYLDVRREGRPMSSYLAELAPEEREVLGQLALVMLRPDALFAGNALPLIRALEDEHGIVVLRLVVRDIDARAFDDQYVTELPIIATGLRLHHRVAATGPTAFTIVTGLPDGFGSRPTGGGDADASPGPSDGSIGQSRSLAAELDGRKGASSPGAEADRSTLRSRFERQSSFHVVIHTSEDAGDFLQGAIGVFGWRAVRTLLASVARGEATELSRHHRDLLLGELAAPPDRNVYEVLLSVKRRIVASLALAGVETDPALAAVYETCSFAGLDLFADKRARYIEMARAERPLLAELIATLETAAPRASALAEADAGDSPPTVGERLAAIDRAVAPRKLAYASWFLSGHEEYHLDDGQALVDLLAANSIVLSPWEQTLVSAALLSDANPNSVFAGQRTYPIDG